MATAIELTGLMQDEQLDAVVGGCKKYDYSYYAESREGRRSGRGGRRNVEVETEINAITVDDININADDGSKVFVTFLQES